MPRLRLSRESQAARYFLDRDGVPTTRMAGKAGMGHIEVARTVLGPVEPGTDVYEQMFALGFVRVLETESEVQVDAPRPLTRKQRRFVDEKRAAGLTVVMNDDRFIRSRDRKG